MANNSSVPYFNWFADYAGQSDAPVRITFVCLFPEAPLMLQDMKDRGCECYWIRFDASKRKRSMILSFWKLLLLFLKVKPDVVHSHLFDDAVPVLAAARVAGVKMRVITKADAGYHWFYSPKWVRFDRLNNWNATHIVAISEENRNFILKNEKADASKVKLIHHGIPEKTFTHQSESDKEYLIKKYDLEGCMLIGTVARLIEWKGYRYIIEAATQLAPEFPRLKFLFVGVGDQLEELRELVAENGLEERILFLGWVERKMIPSFYGILDIYLHAASYEPFGFVIAEAMMNKLPLVSTKTGSALDAIEHRVNGYLVEHSDVKGIVDGIKFVLNNDPKGMGSKSYDSVSEKYSFERMWQNHIDLYLKHCNEK